MYSKQILLHLQIPNYKELTDENNETISLHNTIIASLSEKYQGEVNLSMDGVSKIAFSQPENAIQFALNITNRFHQAPKTPIKIGVIYSFNNENVRSEDLANNLCYACPDGAVLVSESVVDVIKGNTDYSFVNIGSSLFKGANEPTEIYALAGSGLYIPSQNELNIGTKNKNSIAILPFHNTSSDNELDYICDGIAEDVIDSLTRIDGLLVTARMSSFLFKGKELSLLEISRKLNVGYILDGSIRKRGDIYKISYQLVDTLTGFNVVSDSITTEFDRLYDTEKTIVQTILSYFNFETTQKEEKQDYYLDPRAYDFYLKGKHLTFSLNMNAPQKAMEYYKQALDIVPNYCLALSGLSTLYTIMSIYQMGDEVELMSKANEYAQKAVKADPKKAEGYVAKALAAFWSGNWFLPGFEDNLKIALQLSPNNSAIRMFNGMNYLFNGDTDRALIEVKLAKSLDPYSANIIIRLGLIFYIRREYENSYNIFLELVGIEHYHAYSSMRLAWCCIQMNQFDRALKYLEEAKQDYQYYNMIYGSYLVIYYYLKDEDNFIKYQGIIESLSESDLSYYYNQSVLNKLLNRPEKSIAYLDKTMENKLMRFAFIHLDAFWDDYKDIPAFKELVNKIYTAKKQGVIKIESETNQSLELDFTDFLYAEAQVNYTLISWKDKKQNKEMLLRATLSSIEEQLLENAIYRCHRSYLVNKEAGFQFKKTENKAYLKHPDFDISIPVSRAKEKELKEIISRLSD